MPLPLTLSCFSKIQIGFTFLVPAYPGSPGKGPLNVCVCVLNRGQAIGASVQKIWKSHSVPILTKIRLMRALVWPVATYGCESWTPRKNEETRLDAFEMKGLRKILQVSWIAKKTNEWVLNKARPLLHRLYGVDAPGVNK